MSEARQHLKQKVGHEMREYLIISFYLFVVFSLLEVHKSMMLAENLIDYTLHRLALVNALALAKVMLVAQDLHLADRFHDVPLIYPTLVKSFVFTGCWPASRLPKTLSSAEFMAGRSRRVSLILAAAPGREF